MAKTGKNQKMKMLAIYMEIAANCRGEEKAIPTQSLVDIINDRNIACDGRVLRGDIDEINEYIFKYAAGGKGDFDKNSKDNIIVRQVKEHNTYYYYFNADSPYLANKNQKLEMLAVYMEIAENCRSKNNAISAQSLVDKLKKRDISCDSRDLGKHIDEINAYIFRSSAGGNGEGDFDKNSQDNIILRRIKRHSTYYYFNTASQYIKKGPFRFEEILFLFDAVTAAEFMPPDMAEKLHKKLNVLAEYCGLADNERQLKSHMYSYGMFNHNNNYVFRFTDKLRRAIDNKKYIAFTYCNINKDGEPCKTENGEEERIVIPVALPYSGGYYYLRAMPVGTEKLCSFRLDKMKDVHSVSVDDCESYDGSLTAEQKEIITKYKKKDKLFLFMGDMWENNNFTQFGLRFTENHIGDVLDKFGKDITIKDEGDGWYSVESWYSAGKNPIRARNAKELYAWLFQFGTEMQITGSTETINGYKKYINDILDIYKDV